MCVTVCLFDEPWHSVEEKQSTLDRNMPPAENCIMAFRHVCHSDNSAEEGVGLK